MGFGHLNIWIRDLNCNPKLAFYMHLVIKSCCGANVLESSPEIIGTLQHDYPEYNIYPEAAWDGETNLIRIDQKAGGPYVKHVELAVPPGCYVVRAWICADNLWSDRQMVIVNCGETACINLLVPPKQGCIRGVIAPLIVAAQEMRIPQDKLNAAVEVLVKTTGVKKAELTKDLAVVTRTLKASKDAAAAPYLAAFEHLTKQVDTIKDFT
jgi:hypothetical protein